MPKQATQQKCPQHPDVTLRCPACAGSKGGKVSTKAKAAAARKNGRRHKAQKMSGAGRFNPEYLEGLLRAKAAKGPQR